MAAAAGDEAAIFSSCRENGDRGLRLSYSFDGPNWTAPKEDASFMKPEIDGGIMRDPYIVEGPDGTFHLVWTAGCGEKYIGIAHSEDLIHWFGQTMLLVMAHEPGKMNNWAGNFLR